MLTRLWSSELPYVIVIALVLTALLLRARSGERSTYQNTLWLFLLGMLGVAGAHGATLLGFDTAAGLLQVLFRIVWTIALIRIAGFALFRLALQECILLLCRAVQLFLDLLQALLALLDCAALRLRV